MGVAFVLSPNGVGSRNGQDGNDKHGLTESGFGRIPTGQVYQPLGSVDKQREGT